MCTNTRCKFHQQQTEARQLRYISKRACIKVQFKENEPKQKKIFKDRKIKITSRVGPKNKIANQQQSSHDIQKQQKIHLDNDPKDQQVQIKIQIDQGLEEAQQQVLNHRFQNSVSEDSLSYVSNDENLQQVYKYTGLPNLGNTCYLNSVLQMLYCAPRLRNAVMRLSQDKPQLSFHQKLSNIFHDIQNQSSQQIKKEHLKLLLNHLEQANERFVRFQQNDALQCLLQILNLLQEQDPSNSKLNYFKIRYQPRCNCTNEMNNFILQCYFVKSGESCAICRQQIQYLIYNSGPYLIVMAHKDFQFHSSIKFYNKNRDKIYYQNRSFITYYGSGSSGHYISHRRTQQGWIKINDRSVEFIGRIKKVVTPPKLTLYEFKLKDRKLAL